MSTLSSSRSTSLNDRRVRRESASRAREGAEEAIEAGWRLLEEGKVADALASATEITASEPRSAEAWRLLGSARLEWGEVDQAVEALREATKVGPNQPWAYWDLGRAFMQKGMAKEAGESFERASYIVPDEATFRVGAGWALLEGGRLEEAARKLEEALATEPDHVLGRTLLQHAYLRSALSGLTVIEGGEGEAATTTITSAEQIEQLKKAVARSRELGSHDAEADAMMADIEKDIRRFSERVFDGSVLILAIAGAAVALWFLMDLKMGMFGVIWVGVPAYFYWKWSQIPFWAVVGRAIEKDRENKGVAKLLNEPPMTLTERLTDKFVSGLFKAVFGVGYMPFVAAYKYWKNRKLL